MGQDQRIEWLLRKHGIPFDYHEVEPIERIDLKLSKEVQVRLDRRIHPEVVWKYTQLFRAGGQAPPLVSYLHPTPGKLVLLDGLHRTLAAAQADVKGLSNYVVTTSDRAVLDALARSLNATINGIAPSLQETLMQCAIWMRTHHRTIEEALLWFSVKRGSLERFLRVERVRIRLQGLSVRHEGMPETHLERLAGVGNDRVLAEACGLMVRAKLSSQAVYELVTAINAATRTEGAQLAVVEAWMRRPEVADAVHREAHGQPRLRRDVRSGILRETAALDNRLKGLPDMRGSQLDTQEDVQMVDARLRSIRREWDRLKATLATSRPGAPPPPGAVAARGAQ